MTGEQWLIAHIFWSAVNEKDKRYFYGKTFEYHCNALGISDIEAVRSKYLRCICEGKRFQMGVPADEEY